MQSLLKTLTRHLSGSLKSTPLLAAVLGSALSLTAGVATAQGREGSKAFFFGNSLAYHVDDRYDRTNILHWLNELAKASDRSFAMDGRWGFPRDFRATLPPQPGWSVPGVSHVWDSGRQSFGEADFDAVALVLENFAQYQQPDIAYEWGEPNVEGLSPLSISLEIFDWADRVSPDSRLFVYQGWADMASVVGRFPPWDRGFERYHLHNAEAYADWYEALMQKIGESRPDLDVQLIPVAEVFARLMRRGGVLSEVEPQALFVDDAPHGTPTTYFLAALVTFAALYEAVPPLDYVPPQEIDPIVRDNYAAIVQVVAEMVPAPDQDEAALTPLDAAPSADDAAGSTGPTEVATATAPAALAPNSAPTQTQTPVVTAGPGLTTPPLPLREALLLPPGGIRPDGLPALGMGLNGVADWSTQAPFLDHMKTARGWVGHLPGRWGGIDTAQLAAEGYLDPNGWPLAVPPQAERLEAVLLTDMPDDARMLRGTYVMLYEGEADFELTGRAKRVRYEPGRATFHYEPGEGLVGVSISSVSQTNPIRNIRIIRQDQMAFYEAGEIFNPDWLGRIEALRLVRFMDWMMTNGSPVVTWEDRPRLEDASWTLRGVPIEVMIELANRIGADPWFTMPHQADDTYVRRFAETVQRGLRPGLKSYVEYSNEMWNFAFPQTQWAQAQAEALWGSSDTGWIQFYGLRAAQVMQIWGDVYGAQTEDRLVRVVATHTGWPGLEDEILTAPLAYLTLGFSPQEVFDAYAVTGYFGYELGGPEMRGRMNDWLARSEAEARLKGEAQGLKHVALREYVNANRYEGAIAAVTEVLERGSLRELTQEIFPYHAGAASRAGLQLIMYEGGTHLVGHGARVNDERLTGFFVHFNYTPEMAKLYEQLLNGWTEAGGVLFNAFVDVAAPSQWGSWGALRHLDDRNPRWDMLMAYNATGPNAWEVRSPSDFAHGLTRQASDEGQNLQGTAAGDLLVGGAGADTLISGGGFDRLNGQGGADQAVLPGVAADYAFTRDGNRVLAFGPEATVSLVDIEALIFEGTPGEVLAVGDL